VRLSRREGKKQNKTDEEEGNEAKEIVCEIISSEGINPPSEKENIFQQKKKVSWKPKLFSSLFCLHSTNIVRANDVMTDPVIF
jgi:hypothetical protein